MSRERPAAVDVVNAAAAPRVALITGGARRVGAAITESFARAGYRVMLHHGHSPLEAAALAGRLRDEGASVDVVEADLADAHAIPQVVNATVERFGGLDVLVSSASTFDRQPFDEVTPEQWDRVHAINLRAPFFLMQAAGRVMRDGGCIVQLSDHLAFEARTPALIPHQVSKYALDALVTNVASVLAPRIRVNAVAPGLVLAPPSMSQTSMDAFLVDVPLGRAGELADVVDAIHYLVGAEYVNGVTLAVDGGRRLWT